MIDSLRKQNLFGIQLVEDQPSRVVLKISPKQAKILICMSGALLAAVDLLVPANINIAIFYFLLIVLTLWTRSEKWLWSSTLIFMFLTFARIIWAPASIANLVTWVDWLNRGMTATALAFAAIPVHLRLHGLASLDRSIAERERVERALEESYAQLESRVQERTAALATANDELHKRIAEKIQAEHKLIESESHLRELSTQLLRAQDDERRHIARELHDGLGQCLAALKLSVNLLQSLLPQANETVNKRFEECLNLTDEAISQVRTISHLMYPPLLEELGLESAIPWYVSGFEQRSGIKTDLKMPNELGRLPREVELTIFRILQESLTNIHRHSGSRTAGVRLRISNGCTFLEVKDSGKGMPQGIVGKAGTGGMTGVGLRGMRERVRQFAGELEISSGPQGTTVTAMLPCYEAFHAAS